MNDFLFWQFRLSIGFLLLFDAFFLPPRYGKKITAFILAGAFAFSGMIDYFCFEMVGSTKVPMWITEAEIVILQFMPFCVCKYRDFRAMFTGITAAVYIMAGNILGSTLYIFGSELWVCVVSEILVHVLLLLIFVRYIRKEFLLILDDSSIGWGWLCLIPALFYAAVYAVSQWPSNVYENPENLLGIYCILALMVCSYLLIIRIAVQVKKEEELLRSMQHMEVYTERLKYEADVVQEKERETAVLRHDLRHMTVLISTYLDENNTEAVRELIGKANSRIEKMKPARYCQNLAVNGILTHCASMAQKKKVSLSIQAEIPQQLWVDEFEFATVVSNLLENAVNAAGEAEEASGRSVRFKAGITKDNMILEIRNHYGKKPEISKVTGLPLSSGGKGHGYGLRSVAAFAKKNDALFDYEIKDDLFFVRLLIKKPSM